MCDDMSGVSNTICDTNSGRNVMKLVSIDFIYYGTHFNISYNHTELVVAQIIAKMYVSSNTVFHKLVATPS